MKLVRYAKRGYLVLLLFIIFLPSIFAPVGENVVTAKDRPVIDQPLAEQIHQEIENTIRSDATLDLQSPKYRDHPEIVKQVLKDKYGLDINSFTGAKIEGGVLKAGSNEIDLQTGKQIKVEILPNGKPILQDYPFLTPKV